MARRPCLNRAEPALIKSSCNSSVRLVAGMRTGNQPELRKLAAGFALPAA